MKVKIIAQKLGALNLCRWYLTTTFSHSAECENVVNLAPRRCFIFAEKLVRQYSPQVVKMNL